MKKLIACLLMVAGVTGALAQGTVTFITFNSNTSLGTTFKPDGTTLADSTLLGQLWWSASSAGTFAPFDISGAPQPFQGTSGYINDGAPGLSGTFGGDAVFVQMRVWNAAAGSDWNTAVGANPPTTANPLLTMYGISATKSRTLGGINSDGDPVPNQQFNTFANLTLTAVPEPTTVALAGLGLADRKSVV